MHLNLVSPRRQYGVSLLESLVALLVAALGVLGILGMQMRTLVDTQTSVRRAQAVRLIEDLGERMKTNPNALLAITDYTSGYSTTASAITASNCSTAACTPSQQAHYDLRQWKTAVEQALPLGQASVFLAPGETAASNRRQLGVMVAWRENERAGSTDTDKQNVDASRNRTSGGTLAAGTDTANQCPDGFTCHLQYLPVSARCAPYKASGAAVSYCI